MTHGFETEDFRDEAKDKLVDPLLFSDVFSKTIVFLGVYQIKLFFSCLGFQEEEEISGHWRS